MSNYDRDAAVTYAKRFWDKVCDDGYVAVLEQKAFLPKSKVIKVPSLTNIIGWNPPPGFNEDDCTHFVSCCIGHGGRLPLGAWDIPPAYGSLSPMSLMKVLQMKGYVKVLADGISDAENVRRNVKDLWKKGDIFAYGKGPNYGHMALHIGDGKIACHSFSRSDKDFTDVSIRPLTYLQIL